MRIIKDVQRKVRGTKTGAQERVVTVVLRKDEQLIAVDENAKYHLPEPLDMVVGGNYVANATKVYWCSILQKWEPE
jgi:hypothetical protein